MKALLLSDSNSNPIDINNGNNILIIPLDSKRAIHLNIPGTDATHIKSISSLGHNNAINDIFKVIISWSKLINDLEIGWEVLRNRFCRLVILNRWDRIFGTRFVSWGSGLLILLWIILGCWILSGLFMGWIALGNYFKTNILSLQK